MNKLKDYGCSLLAWAVLFGFFWLLSQLFPPPGIGTAKKTGNIYVAREIATDPKYKTCDFAYLGIWEVENFGKMELFCEEGQYFGEIGDIFSIALGEKTQKGFFNAVFCQNDECFAVPVMIEGDLMRDMPGLYMQAVRE